MKTHSCRSASQPSVLVPVTTMEEISVLTPAERENLRASLDAAESDIASGKGAPYDREEVRSHFERALAGKRASVAKPV
jgi:hypothetical protein